MANKKPIERMTKKVVVPMTDTQHTAIRAAADQAVKAILKLIWETKFFIIAVMVLKYLG